MQLDNLLEVAKFSDSKTQQKVINEILKKEVSKIIGDVLNLSRNIDVNVRRFAVKILVNLNNQLALERLYEMLNDADVDILKMAITALCSKKYTKAVSRIVGFLSHKDKELRWIAVNGLNYFDSEVLLNPLLRLYQNGVWVAKNLALELLENKSKVASKIFEKLINSNEPDLLYWAIRIATTCYIDVDKEILDKLWDYSKSIRLVILDYVKTLRKEEMIEKISQAVNLSEEEIEKFFDTVVVFNELVYEKLIELLAHKNWLIRRKSSNALEKVCKHPDLLLEKYKEAENEDQKFWLLVSWAKIARESAVDFLIEKYELGEELEKKNVLVALSYIDSLKVLEFFVDKLTQFTPEEFKIVQKYFVKNEKNAVPVLIPQLYSKVWLARKRTYEVFLQVKDIRYLLPLFKLIDDSNEDAKYWATRIISERINDFKPYILQELEESSGEKEAFLVTLIGKLGLQEYTDKIYRLLFEDSILLKKAVIEALADLKAVFYLNKILKFADNPNHLIRQAVVYAIEKLGDNLTAKRLLKYLDDKVLSVRQAAIEALGKFGLEEFVELLPSLLQEENPSIRKASLIALAKLKEVKNKGQILVILKSLYKTAVKSFKLLIIRATNALESKEGFDFLKYVYEHSKDINEKLEILDVLSNWQIEEVSEFLINLANDPDWRIREKTSQILAKNSIEDSGVNYYKQRVVSLYKLGLIFLKGNRIQDAITSFKRVISIEPGFYNAYIQLANILKSKGQWHEALKYLALAKEIVPTRPEAYFLTALIKNVLGDEKEAIAQLKDVLKIAPNSKYGLMASNLLKKWRG